MYSFTLLLFLFFLFVLSCFFFFFFFFFNDTATTEIYTLSLHDALPICLASEPVPAPPQCGASPPQCARPAPDRKSTRLNSSHQIISYAVFCLKKKKKKKRKCKYTHRTYHS